jgi:hypothetical protein
LIKKTTITTETAANLNKNENDSSNSSIFQDWTESKPLATLHDYFARVVGNFDYAHPESRENARRIAAASQDEFNKHKAHIEPHIDLNLAPSITQLREFREGEDKVFKEQERADIKPDLPSLKIKEKGLSPVSKDSNDEFNKHNTKIESQIDLNVREAAPSITQLRDLREDREFKKDEKREQGLVDLQIKTKIVEPIFEARKNVMLNTMDMERESTVDNELRWEKEHGMEPNPPPPSQSVLQTQPLTEQEKQIGSFKRPLRYNGILSEADIPFPHRPSVEDYEYENSLYSEKEKAL